VLTLLHRGAARLDGLFGQVVRGLMVENLTDPDRTTNMRANMFVARNLLMREILHRAAARGDIPATAVRPQLIGLALALVDHHFLIHGTPSPTRC
jgi:hypothetical protein